MQYCKGKQYQIHLRNGYLKLTKSKKYNQIMAAFSLNQLQFCTAQCIITKYSSSSVSITYTPFPSYLVLSPKSTFPFAFPQPDISQHSWRSPHRAPLCQSIKEGAQGPASYYVLLLKLTLAHQRVLCNLFTNTSAFISSLPSRSFIPTSVHFFFALTTIAFGNWPPSTVFTFFF